MTDNLKQYKAKLIALAKTNDQKKFIEDAFTRWYINSPKKDIIPKSNIAVRKDLDYANKKKELGFKIDTFINDDKKLFKLIFSKKSTSNLGNSDYRSINPWQFGRLQKLYIGKPIEFYANIDMMIGLYEILGINSLHLAMPPIFKGIELFGSPINTINKEYCSIFKLEKDFGSLGSFWDYNFHKDGLYLCNPPFDENIVSDMAKKLNIMLKKTKYAISIVITIPVWDSETQRKLGIKDYGLEFNGLTDIKKSKYYINGDILDRNIYRYWNYYTEEYIPACWTHLLLMSNIKTDIDLEDIKQKWKNAVSNKYKPEFYVLE